MTLIKSFAFIMNNIFRYKKYKTPFEMQKDKEEQAIEALQSLLRYTNDKSILSEREQNSLDKNDNMVIPKKHNPLRILPFVLSEVKDDKLESLRNIHINSLKKHPELVNKIFLASITFASFSCFKYLLENFTAEELGLNKKNEEGLTPLIWIIENAVTKENMMLFGSKLVNHKDIDLTIRDNNGNDAKECARFYKAKSSELLKLIRGKTEKRKIEEPSCNRSWAQQEHEKRTKKEEIEKYDLN